MYRAIKVRDQNRCNELQITVSIFLQHVSRSKPCVFVLMQPGWASPHLEAEGDHLAHVVRELLPDGLFLAPGRKRCSGGGPERLLVERAETTCRRLLWAVQKGGGRRTLEAGGVSVTWEETLDSMRK